MSARTRGRESIADMVRSLGLVLLVIGGVYVLARPGAQTEQRVRVVDYAADVAAARQQAAYPVLAPLSLPAGWRATSSRVEPAGRATGLHIGFVTPADRYAALEESDAPAEDYLAVVTSRGSKVGTVAVDGTLWDVYTAPDGTRALVRPGGPATVAVVGAGRGGAGQPELVELATSLR